MPNNGLAQSDLLGLANAMLPVARSKSHVETYKYNSYPVVDWLKGIATPWEGGESVTWSVRVNENGSARSVGFHANDSVNITDNTVKMAELMKFKDASFGFDKKEVEMNKRGLIYRILPERRSEALESIWNKTEEDGLLGPSSSSDTLCNWGLLNWLTYGPAGAYTDGFQGYTSRYRSQTSNGAQNTTTMGGQNRQTAGNGRLKNWCGVRSTKMGEPFLKQFHHAMERTKFKPPAIGSQGVQPNDAPFQVWMPLEDLLNLRPFIDSKNSNFGKDVTTYSGTMHLFQMPVMRIPCLDPDDSGSDADFHRTIAKPIVAIRKNSFEWMHLPGRWLTEGEAVKNPNNHDGVLVFIDSSGQLCPLDLRTAGFNLHLELPGTTT